MVSAVLKMATTIQNLPEIRIGRDWLLTVQEQTVAGNFFNLSGYVIELCIKMNATDTDDEALFRSITLANPNLPFGRYGFMITNETTENWGSGGTATYEIIYQDPTGFTRTKYAGSVPITPSITLEIL